MFFEKEVLQKKISRPVKQEITDHSRWSVSYTCIFEHEGKYYETSYEVGATEAQDQEPFEYDEDLIWCSEVEEREVTVKQWFAIDSEPKAAKA